ncbi:RNA 2'-phosphotransferase [Cohnella faecalis]|uniref:Probable RNA 2'-phosphotransferase n=1 Tax=Cohnella faecalis TaxID=2315694 RepID=A0A398CP03_9BACL|nr:RNA 2'-phosphotransferase [Cohnella faecalis]RIE00654.1 RNA 2'-phosphotransferase [Cohnella faecalis]
MLGKEMETSLSKFMTKLLRHTPEEYGLILDSSDGSCLMDELLFVIQSQPKWAWVKENHIRQVVNHCEKQRFEIAGQQIKARYGHSHSKVTYDPGIPPLTLFHGTTRKAAPIILKEGIHSMNRQYVHLSEGTHFASLAGSRRGELVILRIDTAKAAQSGVTFFCAGNEVWLAESIPSLCCSIYTE